MTECNRKSLSFSSLGRQKIIANFDGGRLNTDAGGLLLREADRRLGLTASLAECIADPRDPARITHDLRTLLAQRVRPSPEPCGSSRGLANSGTILRYNVA